MTIHPSSVHLSPNDHRRPSAATALRGPLPDHPRGTKVAPRRPHVKPGSSALICAATSPDYVSLRDLTVREDHPEEITGARLRTAAWVIPGKS